MIILITMLKHAGGANYDAMDDDGRNLKRITCLSGVLTTSVTFRPCSKLLSFLLVLSLRIKIYL